MDNDIDSAVLFFAELAADTEPDDLVDLAVGATGVPLEELLTAAAHHTDTDVRWAAAQLCGTCDTAATILAHDTDVRVLRSVAAHTTSARIAAELVEHPSDDISRVATRNEHLDAELIVQLCAGGFGETLRLAALENTAASEAALRDAATCDDPAVRTAAAAHQRTPLDVLAELAEDRSCDVREAVAGNTAAGAKIIAKLAGDDDMLCHLAARRTLALLTEEYNKAEPDVEETTIEVIVNTSATPAT